MCPTRMWIYTYLISIGGFYDGSAIKFGHFGELAQEGQFKYMAILTKIDGTQCSGAVIDSYHILTAANCVTNLRPENLIVTVGTVDLTSKSYIDRAVRTIHIHPEFKGSAKKARTRGSLEEGTCKLMQFLKMGKKKRIDNDIAVVKLKMPLPLGGNITSLILPCNSSIPQHRLFDFPGWGIIENGYYKSHLKYTKMAIYPPSLYDASLPDLKNGLYAFDVMNKESTEGYGDIGSPLVTENIVYGIVYGRSYIKPSLIIFLKVHDYRDFIESTMSDTTSLG